MNNLEKYKNLLSEEYANKLTSFEESFEKQGIDSLDRFSIILEISDSFNIDIPEKEFSKLDSLSGIDKVLSKIQK